MQPSRPPVRIGVGRPPPPAAAPRPITAAAAASPSPPAPVGGPLHHHRGDAHAVVDRPRHPRGGGDPHAAIDRLARPPLDPAGILCDASDRPLLCCSLQGGELVVGSADHALYSYDLDGRPLRRLYGPRHGHIDWISAVAHLPDGRLLSGGGDGKLCLWPRAPSSIPSATCQDLDGHASAVSQLAAVPGSRLAFSAAYDGTVKLWDTTSRRQLACLDAGRPTPTTLDPVVAFAFGSAHLLSGTRSGSLHLWDLASATLLGTARAAHHPGQQVTCVLALPPDIATGGGGGDHVFATGGQDGRVNIWDTRANALSGSAACVQRVACHAHADAAGGGRTAAVGCLAVVGPFLCSGGAEGRVCVLDPRAGFGMVKAFHHHGGGSGGTSPVYALKAADRSVLFSGGGDGMVLAYDVRGLALCFGLHANRGAVRCLAASEEVVVAAGDDGKALVYSI